MAVCPLCVVNEGTCKSHIYPDLLHRAAYDERHSMLTIDQDAGRKGERHTGYWERLLCPDCEGRLNRLETYFADAWFNSKLRPSKPETETIVIKGLDYARFKLFHLSVLWRASVTDFEAFRHVRLGTHEERIRRMIWEERAGSPDEYRIAGSAILDDDGTFKDDILQLPAITKIDGHTVYRMLYGGVFWFIPVSKHLTQCPVPAALQLDGSLALRVDKWSRNPAVLDLAKDVQARWGRDEPAE